MVRNQPIDSAASFRGHAGLPSQQLLHARPSQDFGRARGDAIDPAMELLHGEAVHGRRLADVNLQARSRA